MGSSFFNVVLPPNTSYKRRVYYVYCSLIFMLLFCFSCKQTPNKIEVISFVPDLEIDMLSDSTFFRNINCMVEYDGDIYISMDQRMQVARMDKDLNMQNTIGNLGRGPNEFIFINNFFVANNIVWIGDVGKQAYLKFSPEGEFISVDEKSKNRYTLDTRFWIEDTKVYYSQPDLVNEMSLALLDLDKKDGDNFFRFGAIEKFESPTKTEVQNQRHVFVNNSHIITVPRGIPVIERYDKSSLKLVETFDVRTIPEIDEWYNYATGNFDLSDPRSAFIMIFDAYLNDGLLYVLYLTPQSLLNKTPKEFIGALVFDVDGDKIEYVKRYTFGSDALHKICVTDDYIYGALSGGGVIKRYPLKQ